MDTSAVSPLICCRLWNEVAAKRIRRCCCGAVNMPAILRSRTATGMPAKTDRPHRMMDVAFRTTPSALSRRKKALPRCGVFLVFTTSAQVCLLFFNSRSIGEARNSIAQRNRCDRLIQLIYFIHATGWWYCCNNEYRSLRSTSIIKSIKLDPIPDLT